MKRWLLVGITASALVMASHASAKPLQLPPFKDKLFQYPGILETSHKGAFVKVTYDKYIDIHKRDVILEREVKRKYVSEKPRWSRKAMRLTVGKYLMKYYAVGQISKPAKFIVVYIHGSGGSRFQGINDWTFGGNFNRIQNLAVRNGGSLSFARFQRLRRYRDQPNQTDDFTPCKNITRRTGIYRLWFQGRIYLLATNP